MAQVFFHIPLLLFCILPATFFLLTNDGLRSGLAWAQEEDDIVDGEDEVTVEAEEEPTTADSDTLVTEKERKPEEDEEEKPLQSSPDADSHILFTQPLTLDLPAGGLVKYLVGFTNKGEKDFLVESIFASFRYPMDFSFFIQNFSTTYYNKLVEPKKQATFDYAFTPSETFNARPFGLTILLDYKDSDGIQYQDAVFNDTINIIEPDEGLDGETFFLYVFLAACAVLLLVVGQQFLASFSRKRPVKKQTIEMGTQNTNNVDYDWLPPETLNEIRKSKLGQSLDKRDKTPKQSPRQRRTLRGKGHGED